MPPSADRAFVDIVATPAVHQFIVRAEELGDNDSIDRMRHRVRLARTGRASLRRDEKSMSDEGRTHGTDDVDLVLPAIGESGMRIRVVVEEDSARVAVWVDRKDTWESIVAPVRVAGQGGAADKTTGAWLDSGAAIKAGVRSGKVRPIEVRDEYVAIAGSVPPAFVGHVWLAAKGDHALTDMDHSNCPTDTWKAPEDKRPMALLAEKQVIRAAAGDTAPVVATLKQDLDVAIVVRGAAWSEVELFRPRIRVRGHVPTTALQEVSGVLGGLGSCSGRGFGMSHADRIEVEAGTCLYDKPSGEVAGVQIARSVRYGSRKRGGDEWPMVYVDTPWALATMYVHEVGRDPAVPVLESCTGARPRRPKP